MNMYKYMCVYHTYSCHSIQCAVTRFSPENWKRVLWVFVFGLSCLGHLQLELQMSHVGSRALKENNSGFLMVPDVASSQ